MSSLPSLEVRRDQVSVTAVELTGKPEWFIGRSPECEIVLAHPSISRRHARVFADDDGGFYVDDLKSTHGTVVAGQPLVPGTPQRLFDGLRLAFGSSSFELVPINMMAAVMAAMRAAQAEQTRRQQEAEEMAEAEAEAKAEAEAEAEAPATGPSAAQSAAHRRGEALLAGGEVGVAAEETEVAEEESMRAFLPMSFGKMQDMGGASLEAQHATHARGGGLSLKEKKAKAKKSTIKMGANLGASIGA